MRCAWRKDEDVLADAEEDDVVSDWGDAASVVSGWGESDEDEAGVQAEAWAGVEAEAVPEAEEDDAASVVSGWDYEAEDYEAEDE